MNKFLKTIFSDEVDVQEIIKEIHNEFDTASDKILEEAKSIIAKDISTEKAKRLQNLGFTQAAGVKESIAAEKEKEVAKSWAELVEYYQTWHPKYKFITQVMVEKICTKYALVYADVKYYKGDVPMKNIAEIESFKNDEMKAKTIERFDAKEYEQILSTLNGSQPEVSKLEKYVTQRKSNIIPLSGSFLICAPEKDFDMRNMVRKGFKLEYEIPDPIVLKEVRGGYLVVSKWGLEGNDELLVNEKQN